MLVCMQRAELWTLDRMPAWKGATSCRLHRDHHCPHADEARHAHGALGDVIGCCKHLIALVASPGVQARQRPPWAWHGEDAAHALKVSPEFSCRRTAACLQMAGGRALSQQGGSYCGPVWHEASPSHQRASVVSTLHTNTPLMVLPQPAAASLNPFSHGCFSTCFLPCLHHHVQCHSQMQTNSKLASWLLLV